MKLYSVVVEFADKSHSIYDGLTLNDVVVVVETLDKFDNPEVRITEN